LRARMGETRNLIARRRASLAIPESEAAT
jgi:hypothetical protein